MFCKAARLQASRTAVQSWRITPSTSSSSHLFLRRSSSSRPEVTVQAAPKEDASSSSSSSLSITASPPVPTNRNNTSSHPFADNPRYFQDQEQNNSDPSSNTIANLPSPPLTTPRSGSTPSSYAHPPFDTHRFFVQLEMIFPEPIARSLMRASRALLVDRIGKVRRDALGMKDLENQAYLFRAALSELKTEITLIHRNESASIHTSLTALRRELDALDNKMKAEIANMKHEIQMDMDDRKTGSRTDRKKQDLQVEEILSNAIVSLGELKTLNEEVKWTNMRRFILTLGSFAIVIVALTELLPKPKPTPPPLHPSLDAKQPEAEGLERMDWVT